MPEVTRRAVLAAGGLTIAASLVRSTPASGAAAVPGRSSFAALVGTAVVVHTPTGNVRAVIDAVTDIVGAPAGSARAYSVMLVPKAATPDGIYRISSARLGSVKLFLANVNTGSAARLQAIVNTYSS